MRVPARFPGGLRRLRPACLALACLAAGACTDTEAVRHSAGTPGDGGVPAAVGGYKIGTPYRIAGTWYYPTEDYAYEETGIASWYGPKFHGRYTANGEVFDMNGVTAAHRTLPMPSLVRVVNLENGRSIIVRVNDRGPFARGRIIDLSRRASQLLGFQRQGTARVRVQIMAEESRRMKMLAIRGKMPETAEIVTASAVERSNIAGKAPPRADGAAARPPPVQAPIRAATTPVESVALAPLPVTTAAPPQNTRLFVQAGAFVKYESATEVRSHLSRFGATLVSEAQVGARRFYRVRIGPLRDVPAADRVLEQVVDAGFPGAQLIVD